MTQDAQTQDARPRLLRALAGETLDRPPIWFMRQAGRFLPEYRELRAKAPEFMAFCKNSAMAAEATLQPLRRFPFDAAIVFADILTVPEALGQAVWFEAGEGPRLGELPSNDRLADQIEASTARLSYVGETLERVRAELEPDRALIGFAGGPWTVGTYMLEGSILGPQRPAQPDVHPTPPGSKAWSTSWPRPPPATWPCRPRPGRRC